MTNKTSETLKEKLTSELQETDYAALLHYFENKTLFIIDQKIDLIEAACAVASDDIEKVKIWQKMELIRNLTDKENEDFSKTPHLKMANFLIVQPFVLMQKLEVVEPILN